MAGHSHMGIDMTAPCGALLGRVGLLAALAVLAACGDGGGAGNVNVDPCGGACPADECFGGSCIGGNNGDAGPDVDDTDAPDTGPDAEPTCEVDADCADTEYCSLDGQTGACRTGCRLDGCGDGQLCDPVTRVCSEGCQADTDCPDDAFCALGDGDVGACREGCRSDDQCEGGLTCLAGAGVCVADPCDPQTPCPSGFHCDELLAHCLPGCVEDLDCDDRLSCVEGACVGTDCQADDECLDDQYCSEGRCAPGCRDDGSCGLGEICPEDSRACRLGCRDDDGCDVAEYCEAETMTCLAGCRDDDACSPGMSCLEVPIDEEGTLRRRCIPTPCTEDGECADEFYCAVGEGECAMGCRVGRCPEGTECDDVTRACVEAGCGDTSDCLPGNYCDRGLETPLCVPGCDGEGQCPNDQPCQVETNTCGCAQDVDCADGQICDRAECVAACTDHADCGDGFFCDVESGLCLEGCFDDAFEPNDTLDDPVPIDPGSYDMRMCYGAQIGEDYQDCFVVDLGALDEISVVVVFDEDESDLDLNLYSPQRRVLARGRNDPGREEVAYEVQDPGQYLFCVVPQGLDFESDYQLTVAVQPGQGCLDDESEADGDDTCPEVQGDAIDLLFGQPHTRDNRTICAADEDYVAVNMGVGERLDVTVDRTCGLGALDAQIIDSDCQRVLARSIGDERQRSITFIAPADGTYTVRTFAPLLDDDACYMATFELSAGEARCEDDSILGVPLEPNDSAQGATLLGEGRNVVEGLAVCVDDEDWYSLLVETPGHILRATVCQNVNDDPLRVEIRTDGGDAVVVATQDAEQCKTAETMPLDDPGAYYVRVLSTADVVEPGIRYDLTTVVGPAEECLPDNFEPNEDLEGAAPIGAGQHTGTLCRGDGDQDWFRFELRSGDEVELSLTYDHDITQLGAVLYTPNGDVADILFPDRDDPDVDTLVGGSFFVSPQDAGDWRLEVPTFDAGLALAYTVDLSVVSPECDDEFEDIPNDSCEAGQPLAPFTSVDGFVCGPSGDEDWYCTDVAAGQTLRFFVEHFHFDGNLELEVYQPCGVLVGFSYNSGEDFEEVVIDNTDQGTYCARVFGRSAVVQNNYAIDASIE